ncbi:hypothetical protein ACRRTK_018783 [Alexandromys fortis]
MLEMRWGRKEGGGGTVDCFPFPESERSSVYKTGYLGVQFKQLVVFQGPRCHAYHVSCLRFSQSLQEGSKAM